MTPPLSAAGLAPSDFICLAINVGKKPAVVTAEIVTQNGTAAATSGPFRIGPGTLFGVSASIDQAGYQAYCRVTGLSKTAAYVSLCVSTRCVSTP